ncbi:MAG: NYN domain-containing protein [Planctomycetota bacterium]
MLVVDTYNVLGVTGVLPPDLAGLDVEGLADLIRASRHARDPALLVCDGTPPGRPWRGRGPVRTDFDDVRVAYAGPGREADDLIEQLLFDHSAARRMTVVSNDRRIQRAARKRRAGVLPSDDFLRGLAADHQRGRASPYPEFAKAIPLAQDRVSAWLRTFDVGPELVDDIANALGLDRDHVRRQLEQLHDAPDPDAPDREYLDRVDPKHDAARADSKPAGSPSESARTSPDPAESAGSTPLRPPADPGPIDPVLLEALEEWRGRLSLDDLDMGRWLGDGAHE